MSTDTNKTEPQLDDWAELVSRDMRIIVGKRMEDLSSVWPAAVLLQVASSTLVTVAASLMIQGIQLDPRLNFASATERDAYIAHVASIVGTIMNESTAAVIGRLALTQAAEEPGATTETVPRAVQE